MAANEWHDWHDFYMLLGTASAALVALLFVAVSIGANFLTPERSVATRTFMSPVVFHFSMLLLISLVMLVPTHTALSLAIGNRAHRRRRTGLHHARSGRSCPRLGERYRRPVRLWDFAVGRLFGDACRGRTGYFTPRTGRRCFGGSRPCSPCGEHSQCLGPDARFCAPNRKQKLRHLSDRDKPSAWRTALGARGRIRISISHAPTARAFLPAFGRRQRGLGATN
jgi:hypothetical protein